MLGLHVTGRGDFAAFDCVNLFHQSGEQGGVGFSDQDRKVRPLAPECCQRLGVAPGNCRREALEWFIQQQTALADHQSAAECGYLLLAPAQHASGPARERCELWEQRTHRGQSLLDLGVGRPACFGDILGWAARLVDVAGFDRSRRRD
jgi:hypothetical protein